MEKKHILWAILTMEILTVGTVTLSLPHDIGDMHGTIPDEWGYYDWGMLYARGIFAVPLSDVEASGSGTFIAAENTLTPDMAYALTDNMGRKTLVLTVTYQGEPLPGLSVTVNGISQGETDEYGKFTRENITNVGRICAFGYYEESYFYAEVDNTRSAVRNYYIYPQVQAEAVNIQRPIGNVTLQFSPNVERVSVSDSNGTRTYPTSSDGRATVVIHDYPVTLTPTAAGTFTFSAGGSEPQVFQAGQKILFNGTGNFHITVEAQDSLGQLVNDADVIVDGHTEQSLKTDSSGKAVFDKTLLLGAHTVTVKKDGINLDNMAMSVSEVDGKYYLVSHWPPGYSIFLGLMSIIGLEWAAAAVLMAISTLCMYAVARNMWGDMGGFFSAFAYTASPLSISMVYSRYMADYPSTAMAVIGFFFIYFAVKKSGKVRYIYAALSGISFGAATAMRYSTVVSITAPAVLFLFWAYDVLFTHDEGWKPHIHVDRDGMKKMLITGAVFTLGLALILGPLAYYNDRYYGSPTRSGYQLDSAITIDSGSLGNESAQSDTTSDESLFEAKFILGQDDIESIPRKVSLLFFLSPLFFMGLIASFRNHRETLALASWALAVTVVYISQGWAGSWVGSPTRSMEDMRYFLPALAPLSIIAGAAFRNMDKLHLPQRKMALAALMVLLVVLSVSSTIVTAYAVHGQVERMDGMMGPGRKNPPPQGKLPPGGMDTYNNQDYIDATTSDLLENPLTYDHKNVHVKGLKIHGQINNELYSLSEDNRLQLHLDKKVILPKDTFEVWGEFRPAFSNKEGTPQGAWELNIRNINTDRIVAQGSRTDTNITYKDSMFNIRFIKPEKNQILQPEATLFVVKTVPPADEATFIMNGVTVKGEPGRYPGDFTAHFTPSAGVLKVEIKGKWGNHTEITNITYHVGETTNIGGPGGDKDKNPGIMEETGTELFCPEELIPALWLNLTALVIYIFSLILWGRHQKENYNEDRTNKGPGSKETVN